MTTDAVSVVVVLLFALLAGVVAISSSHATAANRGGPWLSLWRRIGGPRLSSSAVKPRDLAD
jgi:hypothetical protein